MQILSGSRRWVPPPMLHLQASARTNAMVYQRADYLMCLIRRDKDCKSYAAKDFGMMVYI